MKLSDLGFDDGDAMVSLKRLTGKTIQDVALQPVMIPGVGALLAIMRVDFTDGTHLNAHAREDEDSIDTPYLAPGTGLQQPGFDEESLTALHAEWYGDEEE